MKCLLRSTSKMTNHYYNYAIIRFLPCRDIGEFINIGIILHGSDGSFSSRVVEANYPRVKNVFSLLPEGLFPQQLQLLRNELTRIEKIARTSNIEKQKQLFRNTTEPSEGVFTYSQRGTLFVQNSKLAINELFIRYVSQSDKLTIKIEK